MLVVIIVITLLIATALLGGYLMLAPERERSPSSELARQVGSRKRWFWRWTGVHKGFRYEYVIREETEFTNLRVRMRSSPMLKFRVTKRNGIDQFWQQSGIGTNAQTGDADFDQKFLVDQKGSDLPSGFFAEADHRKAIAAIFE